MAKAVEEGNIVTPQDIEDSYDQESSKQALELIKHERIDEETKSKAKKVIIEEYKENKRKRNAERAKVLEAEVARLDGNENINQATTEENKQDVESEQIENVETNENTTNDSGDDSIV